MNSFAPTMHRVGLIHTERGKRLCEFWLLATKRLGRTRSRKLSNREPTANVVWQWLREADLGRRHGTVGVSVQRVSAEGILDAYGVLERMEILACLCCAHCSMTRE